MSDNLTSPLSPIKQALLEIRALRKRNDDLERAELSRQEPIAIVGMALRLPRGIATPEAFWSLLEQGGSLITPTPAERWSNADFYAEDPLAPGKMYAQHGGFLEGVDQFDAEFFGISPREAKAMDPQQRLLLEVAWEAFEDASIDVSELGGTAAGVYLGLSNSDYGRMLLSDAGTIDPYSALGGTLSIAAGRISHLLNLRGPSLVVDTACSSSLVALHLACNSLRSGETNIALVGGANLTLLPEGTIAFSKTRMLAADGKCKTFDQRADGYVRGEGCVCLVLKRLSDARMSGDRIHGLIAGSAVNQDGRSATVTAPNGPAQTSVIREALRIAQVSARDVSYVECHGTGTALGDPIEVQALANVFQTSHTNSEPLRIGSVKANVGHLEAAAGLIGVVKILLALRHQSLVPQINFEQGNEHIPWAEIPITVPTERTSWQRSEVPRIASVSAFGFSGTNAHVVLREPPLAAAAEPTTNRPANLLCLSARSPAALRDLVKSYLPLLEAPEISLDDLCFSAALGRTHLPHRLAVIASDVSDLWGKLKAWLEGESEPALMIGRKEGEEHYAIFNFPSKLLVEAAARVFELRGNSAFDDAWERCMDIGPTRKQEELKQFAVGYGIAEIFKACGVVPVQVNGRGVGTFIARSTIGDMDWKTAAQASCSIYDATDDAFATESQEEEARIHDQRDLIVINVGEISHNHQRSSLWEGLLQGLQLLYVRGMKIEWRGLFDQRAARRLALPTYPFQRKSYWLDRIVTPSVPKSQQVVVSEASTQADLLRTTPEDTRAEWMLAYVRHCLQRVLQLDSSTVLKERDRLSDLGMDSLVALELQGMLARELDLADKVPATIAFDAGTVGELARMVLQLAGSAPAAGKELSSQASSTDPQLSQPAAPLTLDEISELSEEDVARLIAESAATRPGERTYGR